MATLAALPAEGAPHAGRQSAAAVTKNLKTPVKFAAALAQAEADIKLLETKNSRKFAAGKRDSPGEGDEEEDDDGVVTATTTVEQSVLEANRLSDQEVKALVREMEERERSPSPEREAETQSPLPPLDSLTFEDWVQGRVCLSPGGINCNIRIACW